MDGIGKKTLDTLRQAEWYNRWLFSLMEPYVDGDILEVGVGIGNFTDFLIKKGQVTAIDVNKAYLNEIKKKYHDKILSGFGNIETNKYFFKDRRFDTIICLNVLEHIRNQNNAVKNMFDLLKSGGKLILLLPAHMNLYSDFDRYLGHFRRYQKNEVDKMLKDAGFSEIKVKYINWWAALGWFIFIKTLKAKSMPEISISIFDKLAKILLWPEKLIQLPFGLSILSVSKK
jgi:SAM-dependent methyltransferase